ncbi:hypothetical protein VTN31DRAFT_3350 [Thermomyces dupontii]|uniref:uncharacterized protein n=1 Tax=Talaromyces thermophilus TaxID=28565 RepID=UPI003742788A
MANDYEKKTVAQLHELLKARGLPTSGRKNELIARLQESDNKQSEPAKATDPPAEDVIDWDDEVPGATESASASASAAKPSTEAGAAMVAAGGKGEVTNPVAVPNQKLDEDPAKTDDLKVEAKGDASNKPAQPEAAVAETQATEDGKKADTTEADAGKPSSDYSAGLRATQLEEEIEKRKARAAKFGIVEETKAALTEAEKALQRAKRFGTADAAAGTILSRLDKALPTERPRKRGRGDDDHGGRGGKRRSIGGRDRNNRPRGGGRGGERPKFVLSEEDRAKAEARKKRFAVTA